MESMDKKHTSEQSYLAHVSENRSQTVVDHLEGTAKLSASNADAFDAAEQHSLLELMDDETDSLRFYYLGDQYKTKIEHFGVKSTYDPAGVLMI